LKSVDLPTFGNPTMPHFSAMGNLGGRAGRGAKMGLSQARPGGASSMTVLSRVKSADRLGRFHQSLGFRYIGVEDDGELVMERTLD